MRGSFVIAVAITRVGGARIAGWNHGSRNASRHHAAVLDNTATSTTIAVTSCSRVAAAPATVMDSTAA